MVSIVSRKVFQFPKVRIQIGADYLKSVLHSQTMRTDWFVEKESERYLYSYGVYNIVTLCENNF